MFKAAIFKDVNINKFLFLLKYAMIITLVVELLNTIKKLYF